MEFNSTLGAIAHSDYQPSTIGATDPPWIVANFRQQWPLIPSPQDAMTDWTGAIATAAESWLLEHPLLAWFIHHPLLSFGLAALGLLLLWSLFQAFVEITQAFWVRLLNVPLHLGRWLLRGLYRAILVGLALAGFMGPRQSHRSVEESHSLAGSPLPVPESDGPRSDDETANGDIVSLLYRLEQITKEQHQILHQLALLAESQHPTPLSCSPVTSPSAPSSAPSKYAVHNRP